jgi:uncharacterized membrane protein (Fun14 family)
MKTVRRDNHGWRKFKSALASTLSTVAALLVIAPLGLVFFYLLQKGAGSVNWDFFTQLPKPVGEAGGGMANAIVGTLELLGIASLIGIPVGVLGGVFLSEYGTAAGNWWLRFVADVLNGVPSIVIGIFAWREPQMLVSGGRDLATARRADHQFRAKQKRLDRLRQLVGNLLLDLVPVNGSAAGAEAAARNQHRPAGQGNRDGNSHVLRPIFSHVDCRSMHGRASRPVHADRSPIAFLARASVGAARSCALAAPSRAMEQS